MPTEPDKQGLLFPVDRPDPATRPAPYAAMMALQPLSRTNDPPGSYEAADQQKSLAGPGRLAVYHSLRAHQGLTSAELAQATGLDRHDAARRLPELERARWIVRGRRRRCTVCGVACVTWFIARPWFEKRHCRPAKRPDRPPGACLRAELRDGGDRGVPPARSCWRLLALVVENKRSA